MELRSKVSTVTTIWMVYLWDRIHLQIFKAFKTI